MSQASGVEIRAFRAAEEAASWLALTEDYSPHERVTTARAFSGR
jgi:hypothetical protein